MNADAALFGWIPRQTVELPNDIGAEQALLGAIYLDPKQLPKLQGYLTADAFYSDIHKKIYQTFLDLDANGSPIDRVTVPARLAEVLAPNSRPEIFATLTEITAKAGLNALHYAAMITALAAKRGFMAACSGLAHAAGNGTTPERLKEMWDKAGTFADHAISGTRKKVQFTDLDEIMSSNLDVPWLAKPILACGDLAVWGAMYGTGKSWTAYALSFCVCTGRPFMDFEIERPGPVIYLDRENAPYDLARIVRRLNGGIPPAFHLLHYPKWRLDEPAGIAFLRDAIEETMPSLVVVDTLSKFHTKNENRAEEIGPVIQDLTALARESGACVLVLHHFGKNPEGTKTPEQLLRGSTAIGDNADMTFSLVKTAEQYIRLSHHKRRHGPGINPLVYSIEDTSETRTDLVIKERDASMAGGHHAKEVAEYVKQHGACERPSLAAHFVAEKGWSSTTFKCALKNAVEQGRMKKDDTNSKKPIYYVGKDRPVNGTLPLSPSSAPSVEA